MNTTDEPAGSRPEPVWLGALRGTVVHGAGRGRLLGFPTANIAPALGSIVPEPAIYSGWMLRTTTGTLHPVTVSVGTNPTFSTGDQVHVEVHCHELTADLYDEAVDVWLVARIRDTVRFACADDLVAAANHDVVLSSLTLTPESRERVAAELRQRTGAPHSG